MRTWNSIALATCVGVLLSCSTSDGHDMIHVKRISALEDSLKAYRDSLKDVQICWTFNGLNAVSDMKQTDIKLGDSCFIDVFIGAYNSDEAGKLGYRFNAPRLELHDADQRGVSIVQRDGRWKMAFKATRLGEDSLNGTIWIKAGRGQAVEMNFQQRYNVGTR